MYMQLIVSKNTHFQRFMLRIIMGRCYALRGADLGEQPSMKNAFGTLPLYVKICALCVGGPLLMFGCTLVVADLNEVIRLHSFSATEHVGLAIGPIFTLVGISFLWPLRPFQTR
jgi:hypothetical protein